jgi:hypothetical protein
LIFDVVGPGVFGVDAPGFWVAQRFTAAIIQQIPKSASHFAENSSFRIRASLQGCRRVPHFSRSLREVGLFADTLPTLNQCSVEFSPPTNSNR